MFPLVALTLTWADVEGDVGRTVILRMAVAVWLELRVRIEGLTTPVTGPYVETVRVMLPENPSTEDNVSVELTLWPDPSAQQEPLLANATSPPVTLTAPSAHRPPPPAPAPLPHTSPHPPPAPPPP